MAAARRAKSQFAARDFFDVWLPALSPSPALLTIGQRAADDRAWRVFERQFTKEMSAADASRVLDLLAALSHTTNFSVGCYCEDEHRCHRSVLKRLLADRDADVIDGTAILSRRPARRK